ncbi:aminotransferase class V-fold PLP-dependent enzyme [Collinsella sp. AGMB00827]|uniref:Aminotransferase class V-fold PLP-dependent enzyme n=1 Tax=Collinsella ureilytica TaxID=2869515 RepID=A0ABS7MKW5_9ACTN|nr:aminotransferase class V-fold PLP-dependent enzyme [Collinsella urealyticum]MBY4798012.1 aminotransferase class V-fold PLP-dependent enzyme [Collinsella urealyticum]
MSVVNLDYAASTPLREEARAAEQAFDASPLAGANPNSLHSLGRQAAAALEAARRDLVPTFGTEVRPSELVFTGGGTEAVALGLMGLARGAREQDPRRNRLIVSAIEHDAVLDNLGALKADGFVVDHIRPHRNGQIYPEDLEALLDTDVAVTAVMFANNETGVIQPIAELTKLAHRAGSLFFCDAIQGWLHAPFDVNELGIDAASVCGHKIGGPVSSGVLYLRARTPIKPLLKGGGQERGLRPGTQDLRSIISLAAAARAVAAHVSDDYQRLMKLSRELYERLFVSDRIHATVGDIDAIERLAGIVAITVDGFESEELILQLDARGFAVSAASACSSASLSASHVLLAMGVPEQEALGSLRISFDDRVCESDLIRFSEALLELVGER